MAPLRIPVAVFCDVFPRRSETFVLNEARSLAALGHPVRVEARSRGDVADPARLPAGAMTGDSRAGRVRALLALLARHPWRCAADLVWRRRFTAEEEVLPLRALAPAARRCTRAGVGHVHAHFATGPALDALRVSRLLGVPCSVTAHAYDIYQAPAGLRAKLEAAAFATSGCDYTVADLRRCVARQRAGHVHRIVMGVDPDDWRRSAPYPDGRRVVAVGRLVEKKGLLHLVEAAALLAARGEPLDELVILGDGPERAALEAAVRRAELTRTVRLPGAASSAQVRTELERAAVCAVPSVIARDGDRDSMPVIAKEALALEVPVVASDAVGLPEVVRSGWGLLVAPGDPRALADGLADLLARPAPERAAMGRAGRAWVAEHCDVRVEAQRLSALIAGAQPGAPASRSRASSSAAWSGVRPERAADSKIRSSVSPIRRTRRRATFGS